MSELKFACPVCGQHIQCDSTKSGSEMECPTCFRKLVVPQRSATGETKLVLAAAEVQSRVVPGTHAGEAQSAPPTRNRNALVGVIVLLLLAGVAAGAVFALRHRLFLPAGKPLAQDSDAPKPPIKFPPAPVGSETNWTLNLAGRTFPDTPVTGRVDGRSFTLEKATVQGGSLTFRHHPKSPEEMSVTISLFAKHGEDLALQNVNIESTWTNAPKVTVRWKDEQAKSVSRTYHHGYALKLQFGAAKGGRLPGRILLSVPDEAKSSLAGTFEAEIRRPSPPRPPKP